MKNRKQKSKVKSKAKHFQRKIKSISSVCLRVNTKTTNEHEKSEPQLSVGKNPHHQTKKTKISISHFDKSENSKSHKRKHHLSKSRIKTELKQINNTLKLITCFDKTFPAKLMEIKQNAGCKEVKQFLGEIERGVSCILKHSHKSDQQKENKQTKKQSNIHCLNNKGFENVQKGKCIKKPKVFMSHLNISGIDKDKILDYHDQFVGKSDDFSLSWKRKLKEEEKPHLKIR